MLTTLEAYQNSYRVWLSWQGGDDVCRPITRTRRPSTYQLHTHLPNPRYL